MDERDFWIQVRRGLCTIRDAIEHQSHPNAGIWPEVSRALDIVVRAIELRWKLAHSSTRTLGPNGRSIHDYSEPPSLTLARSSEEGIGTDGV